MTVSLIIVCVLFHRAFSDPSMMARLEYEEYGRSWFASYLHCRSGGGKLIEITNADIYASVGAAVTGVWADTSTEFWIGIGNQHLTSPTLLWSTTGQAVDVTFWSTEEPTATSRNKCVVLQKNGYKWASESCSKKRPSVCQYDVINDAGTGPELCSFVWVGPVLSPVTDYAGAVDVGSLSSFDCKLQCVTMIRLDRECRGLFWPINSVTNERCVLLFSGAWDALPAREYETDAGDEFWRKFCYTVKSLNTSITDVESTTEIITPLWNVTISTSGMLTTSHKTQTENTTTSNNHVTVGSNLNDRDCSCNSPRNMSTAEITKRDVKMKTMIKDLEINKSNTSAWRRLYISAADDRQSAANLGYVGIGVITLFIVGVVAIDALTLFRHITHAWRNIKNRLSS